jgi:hypothetical protein
MIQKSDDPTKEKEHTLLQFWHQQHLCTQMTRISCQNLYSMEAGLHVYIVIFHLQTLCLHVNRLKGYASLHVFTFFHLQKAPQGLKSKS